MSALDRFYAWAANRRPLFAWGWGDPWILERAGGWFDTPVPIDIEWGAAQALPGGERRPGTFRSPYADWGLPPEARVAHLELLLPTGWDPRRTPVALHFPAVGDEGFERRRRLAIPLLHQGLGTLLLEVPFYGHRRPHYQHSTVLARVSDLWLLGMASWEEGRSLLGWLTSQGFQRLGVCGISMGGHLASQVAGLWPHPLAVASLVTPHRADVVFVEGVVSRYLAWPRLAPHPLSQLHGGPQQALRKVLAPTDLRRFPVPPRPEACVRLGARHDLYVSRESVLLTQQIWPGSHLDWIEAGHVETVAWKGHLLGQCLLEAFERL